MTEHLGASGRQHLVSPASRDSATLSGVGLEALLIGGGEVPPRPPSSVGKSLNTIGGVIKAGMIS